MGEDYLSQPINIGSGGKGLFRQFYYKLKKK